MTKTYEVKFKETHEYTKLIEVKDGEDINELIHDPFTCPMIKHMTDEEYSKLNPSVCNEYDITDRS